jgi:flagella synthesis protein FlgN
MPSATVHEESLTALRLLEILTQEQQLLLAADVDGLRTLTAEKSTLLARMAELANQRHAALAAGGFAASETGMQQWLQEAPAPAELQQTWRTTLSGCESARALNRSNGVLINKHMAQIQQALTILQGGAQANNFYGPTGQATSTSIARRVTAA